MTIEELKKKICKIIADNYLPKEMPDRLEDYKLYRFKRAADALIAAGLTFDKTTAILAERTNGKTLIHKAQYYDEMKHRAEVAENELKLYKLSVKIWQERYSDIRCFNFNIALKQAEKELQEKRKDE